MIAHSTMGLLQLTSMDTNGTKATLRFAVIDKLYCENEKDDEENEIVFLKYEE